MESENIYDYFVIGGGSGGLASAKEAAKYGKQIAVADFIKPTPIGTTWGLGGTCVNVGCIPKKLMHWAAEFGERSDFWELSGWSKMIPEQKEHDWGQMVATIQQYIQKLNWGYQVDLSEKEVKYYNRLAKLIDKNTIQLKDQDGSVEIVKANNILIAVGGRPTFLDNIPGSQKLVITSDDLFSLKTPPGKTLIVGASYIALECAGFLTAFGYDTTVMVRSILLRGFDREIADRIGTYMENHGTQFIKGCIPSNIELLPDGKKKVTWEILGLTKSDVFDTVMLAIGRSSDTKLLGVQEIGIVTNKSGQIIANDDDSTSVPNIFAIGDCTENRPELTPTAIQAGRLLARRLFNGETKLMNYRFCPTTVFTPIEYGVTGYSQEDAKEKFGEEQIKVYFNAFQPLDWNYSQTHEEKEETGLCKLIINTEDSQRVIGLHYLGPNAGEVVQGFSVAVKMGATIDDINDTIRIHPTNAEELINIKNVQGQQSEGGAGCTS